MTYEEIEKEKLRLKYWQERESAADQQSEIPKVPAPGEGGFYEGLGGQAPSFAPGGPDDPDKKQSDS